MRQKEFLNLKRGAASGRGGGNRLPEPWILNITRREHSLDIRLRSLASGDDVPVLVGLDIFLEYVRVRMMPDGQKKSVDLDIKNLTILVLEANSVHTELISKHFLSVAVPTTATSFFL